MKSTIGDKTVECYLITKEECRERDGWVNHRLIDKVIKIDGVRSTERELKELIEDNKYA